MKEDTIFRVFSQSKPISTAAFLTLVDEVRGRRFAWLGYYYYMYTCGWVLYRPVS